MNEVTERVSIEIDSISEDWAIKKDLIYFSISHIPVTP